jgi:hypothetical protein
VKFHPIVVNCNFLVSMIASVAKISMPYHLVQRKLKQGRRHQREWVLGEISPRSCYSASFTDFSETLESFLRFEVSTFSYLLALGVGVVHGSGHE